VFDTDVNDEIVRNNAYLRAFSHTHANITTTYSSDLTSSVTHTHAHTRTDARTHEKREEGTSCSQKRLPS